MPARAWRTGGSASNALDDSSAVQGTPTVLLLNSLVLNLKSDSETIDLRAGAGGTEDTPASPCGLRSLLAEGSGGVDVRDS